MPPTTDIIAAKKLNIKNFLVCSSSKVSSLSKQTLQTLQTLQTEFTIKEHTVAKQQYKKLLFLWR